MNTANLLVELFVEELPPKALNKLGDAFASLLADGLKAQGLAAADAQPQAFASPRRLALWLAGVARQAADKAVGHKLMPASVGLDAQGAATPALLKRLKALGADADAVPRLRRETEGKAEVLYLDATQTGATLAQGLQKALSEAIAKLPIPKLMSYQLADGWSGVSFVRPAHGLVALHGDEVVPCHALGLHSGRHTQGHRFEALAPQIELAHADDYAAALREQGGVIAGFAQRRSELLRQLHAAAEQEGLTPIDDAALLDEVTALVENPKVLVCRFEEAFLNVPAECLILTMKANQKYFPLLDAQGRLTNRFLVVSNIRPADTSRIVQGNERVVRPRLADAKFFFDQDRKRSLESRLPGLDKVVYHAKLGSMGDRVARVQAIAKCIGEQLGGPPLAAQAERAAQLAKADLLTDMVGEFPELQGTMGGYYARHDGEPEEIALAIEQHYRPRFSGDALPDSELGCVVSLADKLESLAGLFGVGDLPSGDRDPFALRRSATGVVRLLMRLPSGLTLTDCLGAAVGSFEPITDDPRLGKDVAFGNKGAAVVEQLRLFVYERIAVAQRDAGFTAQEVAAVLALRPERLGDIAKRLAAVQAFAALPESPALAAANKRVSNILKKAEGAGDAAGTAAAPAALPGTDAIDPQLLLEPAEQALAQALAHVQPAADAAFAQGDFTASLRHLAALKAPVDAFFDGVMVNAEDPALRRNRMALLKALQGAMNRVADLSKLAA